MTLLLELQAIRHQRVECSLGEVLGANLLLHWLDQELGYLRGSQLVPRQGRLGSRLDNDADCVGYAIDREGI